MTNVIDFDGQSMFPYYGHIDPLKVLEGAKKKGLEEVIVLGVQSNGELYLATSSGKTAEIAFLLDLGKQHVIEGYLQELYDDSEES